MIDIEIINHMAKNKKRSNTEVVNDMVDKKRDELIAKGKPVKIPVMWVRQKICQLDPITLREKCKNNGEGRSDSISGDVLKNLRCGESKMWHDSVRRLLKTYKIEDGFLIPLPDEEVVLDKRSQRAKTYQYAGEQCTLQQLSDLGDISVQNLRQRIREGWSVEDAVQNPVKKGRQEQLTDGELLISLFGDEKFSTRDSLKSKFIKKIIEEKCNFARCLKRRASTLKQEKTKKPRKPKDDKTKIEEGARYIFNSTVYNLKKKGCITVVETDNIKIFHLLSSI